MAFKIPGLNMNSLMTQVQNNPNAIANKIDRLNSYTTVEGIADHLGVKIPYYDTVKEKVDGLKQRAGDYAKEELKKRGYNIDILDDPETMYNYAMKLQKNGFELEVDPDKIQAVLDNPPVDKFKDQNPFNGVEEKVQDALDNPPVENVKDKIESAIERFI